MEPTKHSCVHETMASGARVYCWRWYFTQRSLPFASENGQRFHHWIKAFKQERAPAERLFAEILVTLWRELLSQPQAIVTVPPSTQFKMRPEYPLSRCADIAASMSAGVHLKHHLRRIESLPSCVSDNSSRSFLKQRASMAIEGDIANNYESIIVIDDVRTSGSTLEAAIDSLRQHHPNTLITALTFGQTQRTGSTPFPETPTFPELWDPTEDEMARFMQ